MVLLFETAKTAHENAVNRKIMQTRYKSVHESEWNWVGHPVDYIISNNDTLDNLTEQVAKIRLDMDNNQPTRLYSV